MAKCNCERTTLHIRDYKNLTHKQRIIINESWNVYGNYGVKHNDVDHKYIQFIIEDRSEECFTFVNLISEECNDFLYYLMSNEIEKASIIMNSKK